MTKFSALLHGQSVVPVVVLEDEASTHGLCAALLEGGVNVIEVTLRHQFGIEALKLIKTEYPEMVTLAGTVNTTADMKAVAKAQVDGVISPGLTPALLQSAHDYGLPFMPGVATGSEVLLAMEYGLSECKLFPASVVGGISALKAFAGPFSDMKFCPTGGISETDYRDYLALNNVICVGGSWLAPSALVREHRWQQITDLCKATRADSEL